MSRHFRGVIAFQPFQKVSPVCLRALLVLSTSLALGCNAAHRGTENQNSELQRKEIEESIKAQYPSVIGISNDFKRLLERTEDGFVDKLTVVSTDTDVQFAEIKNSSYHYDPSWLPDDTAISFLIGSTGARDLLPYSWSPVDGRLQKLNGPLTSMSIFPVKWSADGRLMAYVVGTEERGELLVVNSDGSRRQRVRVAISSDGDFQWSPTGHRLVVIMAGVVPEIQVIDLDDAKSGPKAVYRAKNGGSIFDVAWSPDEKSVAYTAREGSEFFALRLLDLSTSDSRSCGAFDGDVRYPQFDRVSGRIFFNVATGTQSLLYRTACDGRAAVQIGPHDGGNRLLKIKAESPIKNGDDEASVAILSNRPQSPPCLVLAGELSTKNSDCRQSSEEFAIPSPSLLMLRGEDALIPTLAWLHDDNARQSTVGVVVEVHGGPRLHVDSRWTALTSILWSHGIDLITPNYRGSDGYGYSYEASGDLAKSTQDIVASCKYAKALYGGHARVILLGVSYGADVAAAAAASDPEDVSGVLLLSVTARSYAVIGGARPHFPVVAFHGQYDQIAPQDAKSMITSIFGPGLFDQPRNRWTVLPDEGHVFRRTDSWIRVYSSLLQMIHG